MGDLVDNLRESGLRLLSDPAGTSLAVRRVVLHDERSTLPPATSGVLLLAGLDPSAARAREVVRAAADCGYAAVVARLDTDPGATFAAAADELGIAALGVDPDVEWLHLATMATAVIDSAARDSAWGDPAVGDLFGLANAIAAAAGGSTAIEDFAQRVLAYSTLPDQPIDAERREGILGRRVPDVPENDAQYREVYRTTGVVRFGAEPPALPRVAVAVRAGAEPIGSIWVVDPTGTIGQEAEPALLAAAELAALHLLRARSGQDLARHRRGEVVRGVLTGEMPSTTALARLGVETTGPFAVLAFSAAEPDTVPTASGRLLDLLALQLEPRLGPIGTCLIGSTFYVLAAGSRAADPARLTTLAGDVRTSAARSLRLDVLAAVGPVVDDAAQVVPARIDADRVLALLRTRPDLAGVGSAASLADQLAIAHLRNLLAEEPALASAPARTLLAHDAQHGTTYSSLVLTWLECGRDVSATARRLGVHANTVRYRLRRVGESFGLDLDAPDQVLVLWWTLRTSAELG
ncbi:helix-turn-helix domain-containing protein [Nocardioides aquiterrae]|uniref:PucR family transcriptional regulator n=1 Tax=Nocardioides aquiterrae TaxID=203799 RepID=UPI0031D90CC3